MKEKEGELHLRFRPREFEEFIGSESVKKSILSSLHRTHTFLFYGPRGVGKTTLARLIANYVGAKNRDVIEVDAADKTGVGDARQLKGTVDYAPLRGKNKVYIIDECHMLSSNAMNSLLKTLEEPPEHVYFVLCTTEVSKVIATIRSRCKQYELKPLSKERSGTLLDWVCKEEGIFLHSMTRKILIQRCEGIPRELLINLDKVRDIQDLEEVKELVQSVSEKAEIVELCRLLAKGGNWLAVREILSGLDEDSEDVRRAVLRYLGKVLLSSEKVQAKRISEMIFLFSEATYSGGNAMLFANCYLSTLT